MKKVYSKTFHHYIFPDYIFQNRRTKKKIRLLNIQENRNMNFVDTEGEIFTCDIAFLEKNYRSYGVAFYTIKDFFRSDEYFNEKYIVDKNIELQLNICWNALSRIYQRIEIGENPKNVLDEIMNTLDTCFEIGLTRRTIFAQPNKTKKEEAEKILEYIKTNNISYKEVSKKFHCSLSKISKIVNGKI